MVFILNTWDTQAAIGYVNVFTEMNTSRTGEASFAPKSFILCAGHCRLSKGCYLLKRQYTIYVDNTPFGLKKCSWESFSPRPQGKVQSQEVFDAHAVPGRAC